MISVERFLEKAEFDLPVRVLAVAKIKNSTFVGWNSEKTSPRYRRKYNSGHILCTRHAEYHVLDQLPHNVDSSKVEIYVFRLDGKGKISMAKPCKFCQNALEDKGIHPKNVWYTDWDGSWKKLGEWSKELKEKPPKNNGVLCE